MFMTLQSGSNHTCNANQAVVFTCWPVVFTCLPVTSIRHHIQTPHTDAQSVLTRALHLTHPLTHPPMHWIRRCQGAQIVLCVPETHLARYCYPEKVSPPGTITVFMPPAPLCNVPPSPYPCPAMWTMQATHPDKRPYYGVQATDAHEPLHLHWFKFVTS